MREINYYEILEIQPNASDEVIKMAYKALVKQYHPDSYEGDITFAENKIKEINLAYDTLSDKNKRAVYDKNCDMNNNRIFTEQTKKYVRKNKFADFVDLIGNFLKFLASIVLLYIVIGVFTGNLREWNEKIIYSSKVVMHFINNINIPVKYEKESAEESIQKYIKALYAGDEYSALQMIDSENVELKAMSEEITAIFRLYEDDKVLGDLMSDMKKSHYTIEEKEGKEYIVTFTTCDYAVILEQLEVKINNDTYIAKQISNAVRAAPKNYKKEAIIYMNKIDGKWCVEGIEQQKTFIDALTGNFMGQIVEGALQNIEE